LQAMGEYPGLENVSIARNDKPLGRRVYDEAKKAGDELGVQVVLLPVDQFEDDRGHLNRVEDLTRYRKDCRDPWTRALISATGDVLACCSSKTPMGNLNNSTFMEIWCGEGFNVLRRQILGDKPPQMCRACTGIAWVEESPARDREFSGSCCEIITARRCGTVLCGTRQYGGRSACGTACAAGEFCPACCDYDGNWLIFSARSSLSTALLIASSAETVFSWTSRRSSSLSMRLPLAFPVCMSLRAAVSCRRG